MLNKYNETIPLSLKKKMAIHKKMLCCFFVGMVIFLNFLSSSFSYAQLADAKEVIFKTTRKMPTCSVSVPASIELGDIEITHGGQGSNVRYFNNFNEFSIDISCTGVFDVFSGIQLTSPGNPGEIATGGGAKYVSMISGNSSNSGTMLYLGLEYLEKDNTSVGAYDQNVNTWLAVINTGVDNNSTVEYCYDYKSNRKCRFKPIVMVEAKSSTSQGESLVNVSNIYEQVVTFTLTYG
ncbi:hypothetical protein AAHE65_002758 [Escherichia coli]|nr:hypothetical protein [Escherichia coli]EFJ3063056.1 hypothetical protein [Escherichia coli]EFM0616861.1 hypothetical protein [Escherichia coli]EFN3825654.1 hypothetical protein [Escherichia coli]EGI3894932.1 hypothetical protein [Escherichia coli]